MKTVINNPVIFADVPDVDVIRVDDTYYMVSTTMHMSPGCPIMKSKDLAHWETVRYVFDTLEEYDDFNMINGRNMYSKGQWAPCIRYHNGIFYVCFACNNSNNTYIYSTDDIEHGEWKKVSVDVWTHDPSIFFDGDTPYILSGAGDIRILELEKDLSGKKEGGIDRILLSTPKEGVILRCEGVHAYKIGDYYHLHFIEWEADEHRRRRAVHYRSKDFFGEYERRILLNDDMGYYNKGIAQGALIDTVNGEWYAMLFQDHNAVGRIPYLIPLRWEDDWPVLGDNGRVLPTFEVDLEESGRNLIVADDEFDYATNDLGVQWQWNHNPDNNNWSVTDRPGYLRLTTGHLCGCVVNARNTLTQRTVGPKCETTVAIEITGMKDGDSAGLVALQSRFGTVGVKVMNGKSFICMTMRDGMGGEYIFEQVETELPRVYLKVFFDFVRDVASFYYSKDGENYVSIGGNLKMLYTLDHFMGYRIGLFNYASRSIGGYADFDFFEIKVLQ